jgi:hypothetical protein
MIRGSTQRFGRNYARSAADRDISIRSRSMERIDRRMRELVARRMLDAVRRPPQFVIARDLLRRGLSANEVSALLMRDAAFDRVPEAFRIEVADAAQTIEREELLAAKRRQARGQLLV